MCVVSMVSADWLNRPQPYRVLPDEWPHQWPPRVPDIEKASKQEFDALKKEVERLKKELEIAHKHDIEENEPDCEMDEKVKILKAIADALGVDLTHVFSEHK